MRLFAATDRRAGRLAAMLGMALPIVFGGMIAGPARSACAQPAAPTVEVRGVCVTAAAYGSGREALRTSSSKGTTVTLLVTVPGGGLIAVDDEKMQLAKLADDKGTDLRAAPETIGEMRMVPMPQISADGKACLVELNGPGLPAKGATAILASGSISLKCGSKKETARTEHVALKPGTKVTAGPVTFDISKVGKPQFSFDFAGPSDTPSKTPPAEKFEVTLHASQDCSNIASVTFLDAAGKDLGAKPGSSSSMSMPGMTTVEKSFVLPKKVDTATISITYWTEVKEVTVPFDIKATLGL